MRQVMFCTSVTDTWILWDVAVSMEGAMVFPRAAHCEHHTAVGAYSA